MAFKIAVRPQAHADIFETIDWYSRQSPGLGKKFYLQVKEHYKSLRMNPFFQVRYDNVRCLPVHKFPYMIHFIVEEDRSRVVILGVISTDRDPKRWDDRLE